MASNTGVRFVRARAHVRVYVNALVRACVSAVVAYFMK